jgi:hypothetical protein
MLGHQLLKKQLHGRQYVYIIQSFSLSADLTGQVAHDIGQKLLTVLMAFKAL